MPRKPVATSISESITVDEETSPRALDVDKLLKIINEQEKRQMEQNALMEKILKIMELNHTAKVELNGDNASATPSVNTKDMLIQSLNMKLETFDYASDESSAFDTWYSRYESIFKVDAANLEEKDRVCLLVQRLSSQVLERLSKITSPASPYDLSFEQVLDLLYKTFGSQATLFSNRYACMHALKDPREDLMSYFDRVDDMCDCIKFDEMNVDHFKTLVFLSGLKDDGYQEIQQWVHSRLEADHTVTFQSLREEVNTYLKMKLNSRAVNDRSSERPSCETPSYNQYVNDPASEWTAVVKRTNKPKLDTSSSTSHKKSFS